MLPARNLREKLPSPMLSRSEPDGVMRISSWKIVCVICLVMAVLLSGCLGERASPPTSDQPPVIFVDYQRTGGIAGVNDRVVIFDNGVTLVSTQKMTTEIALNQTERDAITSLFTTNGFFDLEGNYTSGRGGADLMQYRITYYGKTVQTEDTAIPLKVQPVIDEMNRIVSQTLATARAGSPLPHIIP